MNSSIEVRVPDEIKDYKESIIFGLSFRQIICGAAALAIGISTFLLLNRFSSDLAAYATMAVVLPAFCIGFVKKDGYTFEVWLTIKVKAMFGKNKRSYETAPNNLPIEVEKYREVIQKQLEAEKRELLSLQAKQKGIVNKTKKRSEKVAEGKKQFKRFKNRKTERKKRREYDLIEVTEKSVKRKRKAACKALKTAERKNRKIQSKAKKTA